MALALINERTRAPIATEVELASTRATRRRGLLGRDSLSPSSALMLTPCVAVHTAFMRFAIDVMFLDIDGHAVKLVSDVAPWRTIARAANTVILALTSMLVTWTLAIPIGIIVALRPNSISDRLLSFLAFFGMSLPSLVTSSPAANQRL